MLLRSAVAGALLAGLMASPSTASAQGLVVDGLYDCARATNGRSYCRQKSSQNYKPVSDEFFNRYQSLRSRSFGGTPEADRQGATAAAPPRAGSPPAQPSAPEASQAAATSAGQGPAAAPVPAPSDTGPASVPVEVKAPPAASVEAGMRVALVIGNSAYAAVGSLPNPARDASAVARSLREAGFRTVQLEANLSREAMIQALHRFSEEADKADWAVVYYAGHGIEVGGQNYLVPVDARLKSDRAVQFEAVPLDQVLASLDGARKLRLVILDACRDNPFISQMSRTVASRSIGRGLARVEPEGGTLVAYAAKAGQVALDGDGQNSPFVSALVKHVATPGIEIRRLFGLVRDDVLAATDRKQEPFVYGSLGGEELFFKAR